MAVLGTIGTAGYHVNVSDSPPFGAASADHDLDVRAVPASRV